MEKSCPDTPSLKCSIKQQSYRLSSLTSLFHSFLCLCHTSPLQPPSAQITTEKHRMSFPETVDEILDVSEDEGRLSDFSMVNMSTVLMIHFQVTDFVEEDCMGGTLTHRSSTKIVNMCCIWLFITHFFICLVGVAQLTLGRIVSVSLPCPVRWTCAFIAIALSHFLCVSLIVFLISSSESALKSSPVCFSLSLSSLFLFSLLLRALFKKFVFFSSACRSAFNAYLFVGSLLTELQYFGF